MNGEPNWVGFFITIGFMAFLAISFRRLKK